MKPIEFYLNEFKFMAGWLKKLPLPIAFFCLSWLKWLELKYIDAKASTSVSKAIREYNETVRTPEGLLPPERHTEPSEVPGLDIISISSPWQNSQSSDQRTQTPSTTTSQAKQALPKTTDSHQ
ncbi:hypothetical protein P60_gp46 [Synechococcus phage P60]|uniref:Uncharacterized protein n=1 Tax=Synechococcus phage P60 TaxID=2905923 RepID=L0CNR9_9CAUD|nr:hypothetical protein P60_gp46 [Synechococcus phage P60]AGA17898.1 hypothetical protein P60_gp46 [Synechococcus phage P60]